METDKKEKFCGACCWFYGEDTDGRGFCACQKNKGIDMTFCSDMCEDDYVSKKEMRHHMAVLLQYHRYMKDVGENCRCPFITDRLEAMKFAYRYMKVFNNL